MKPQKFEWCIVKQSVEIKICLISMVSKNSNKFEKILTTVILGP